MIAQKEGTIWSKNIGRASIAQALDNKSVTNKKWCLFNIGRIVSA